LRSVFLSTKRNSLDLRAGWLLSAVAALCLPSAAHGQTMKAPDITANDQRIFVYVNFGYIDKYPHYIFNWTGANRNRLMKEY
jgi:alpha-mannosidase